MLSIVMGCVLWEDELIVQKNIVKINGECIYELKPNLVPYPYCERDCWGLWSWDRFTIAVVTCQVYYSECKEFLNKRNLDSMPGVRNHLDE